MKWTPSGDGEALEIVADDIGWRIRPIVGDDHWMLESGKMRYYSGIPLPIYIEKGRFSSRVQAMIAVEFVIGSMGTAGVEGLRASGFEPYGARPDTPDESVDLWHCWAGECHFLVKRGDTWVSLSCDDEKDDHTCVGTFDAPIDEQGPYLAALLKLFEFRTARPGREGKVLEEDAFDEWSSICDLGDRSKKARL